MGAAGSKTRHLGALSLEVKEHPEQWRRSKLAWLCKEWPALVYNADKFLSSYKTPWIFDAARKWLR